MTLKKCVKYKIIDFDRGIHQHPPAAKQAAGTACGQGGRRGRTVHPKRGEKYTEILFK